ncbi:hypothetical protein GP486_000397 [Trichoglossum hirsutum]|uniref:Ankyrin repeat protein n=1 Tax=Trichoglossum hirsutum TaxID=265104 RepID=A0A9P8LJ36_9PEZI|nr:hypothetical protein GP486_000397 [Trichoglossum hirsutum]
MASRTPIAEITQAIRRPTGFEVTLCKLRQKSGASVPPSIDDASVLVLAAVQRNDVDAAKGLLSKLPTSSNPSEVGGQALLLAAAHNNTEIVRGLLTVGFVSRQSRDEVGRTLLHWAVITQDRKLVESLLKEGAEVNVRDNLQQTPFHLAAVEKNGSLCGLLKRFGATVDPPDINGVSLLFKAAVSGDKQQVDFLLEQGDDPSAKSRFGWTAIHFAAANGHYGVVQALVKAGASPNVASDQDITPLDLAKKANRQDIVNYLIDVTRISELKPLQQQMTDIKLFTFDQPWVFEIGQCLYRPGHKEYFSISRLLNTQHSVNFGHGKCLPNAEDYNTGVIPGPGDPTYEIRVTESGGRLLRRLDGEATIEEMNLEGGREDGWKLSGDDWYITISHNSCGTRYWNLDAPFGGVAELVSKFSALSTIGHSPQIVLEDHIYSDDSLKNLFLAAFVALSWMETLESERLALEHLAVKDLVDSYCDK